jgi:ABC-type ATPase with predicted acetyltransferase domain
MWRCENCGEVGELEDGLPSECPDCGSEEVHKQRED